MTTSRRSIRSCRDSIFNYASIRRAVSRKESRTALTISVLALALSGCASSATTGLVTYQLPEDWVADAGLKVGTLTYVDNCVRFEDGDVPVFPDSLTTWDGTTLTFAGEEYAMGDEVSLGGGSPVEGGTISVSIPKACGDGTVIIVSPPPPER
jgi:hypothetical protein